MLQCSGDDLVAALTAPVEPEAVHRLVVLDRAPSAPPPPEVADRLATLPCVVAATAPTPLADVIVADDEELADVRATATRQPLASTALALHLRASDRRGPLDGLIAESTLYSTLQAGPEHQAWRRRHRARTRDEGDREPLRVERRGDRLVLTLDRPHVRNALSSALRDALAEALAVAIARPDLEVHLGGRGPSFCAGGDLDEFATTPDPATAHLVRTARSLGALLLSVADRATVRVHGATVGAGIEVAAFVGTVTAAPDTRIALPELALGLVPGAGGTVSLPRRIGRQRTAWLALTGRTIDAVTAHRWGLVDEVRAGG